MEVEGPIEGDLHQRRALGERRLHVRQRHEALLRAERAAPLAELRFQLLPLLLERHKGCAVLVQGSFPRPARDLGGELIEQRLIAGRERAAQRSEAVGHHVEDAALAPEHDGEREARGGRVGGCVLDMQRESFVGVVGQRGPIEALLLLGAGGKNGGGVAIVNVGPRRAAFTASPFRPCAA